MEAVQKSLCTTLLLGTLMAAIVPTQLMSAEPAVVPAASKRNRRQNSILDTKTKMDSKNLHRSSFNNNSFPKFRKCAYSYMQSVL